MKKDKKKELRKIEMVLFNEEGLLAGDIHLVSIVNGPAIEKNVLFLSEDGSRRLNFSNDVRQEITGPVMTPDKLILQKDKETGEFYQCYFSKETIAKCIELFMKNNRGAKTNIQHSQLLPTNETQGIYAIECWQVVDAKNDKAAALGLDPVEGEWYLTYKVESPDTYLALQQHCNGFSIEATMFGKKEISASNADEKLFEQIEYILNDNTLTNEEKEQKIVHITE